MRLIPHSLLPLLLIGTVAAAAPGGDAKTYRPTPPTIVATPITLAIAAFDRDGDLRVSRTEYDAAVRRSFAAFDRNHDGSLSLIEIGGWAEATLGNSGALPGPFDFDRDGDDKVSLAEFVGDFAQRFERLDQDKDGHLVRSELVSLVDTPLPRRDRNKRAKEQPEEQSKPRR